MKKSDQNGVSQKLLRAASAVVLATGLSSCAMMHDDSAMLSSVPVTVPDGKTYHLRTLDMVQKEGTLMLHGHVYNTDMHNISTAEHIDITVLDESGAVIETLTYRLPRQISYFDKELSSNLADVASVEVKLHRSYEGH